MANNYEYTLVGTVAEIGPMVTKGRSFQVRRLLLETRERLGAREYINRLPIEFEGADALQLKTYRKGDAVEVTFRLTGWEYNGRHYVKLRGAEIWLAEGEAWKK